MITGVGTKLGVPQREMSGGHRYRYSGFPSLPAERSSLPSSRYGPYFKPSTIQDILVFFFLEYLCPIRIVPCREIARLNT